MSDLIIRGEPGDLEELRRAIENEVGPDARLHPVTSAQAGELREPILIGLIVALGGPAVTYAIAVRNALEHVGADPETAREWRGTVWLTFADVTEPLSATGSGGPRLPAYGA